VCATPAAPVYANGADLHGPVPGGGGTITGISAAISAAFGVAGNTMTFTVLKNGAATTVLCTITNPATTCAFAGSVAVAAGDYLAVRMDTAIAGTPPNMIATVRY
jgi:hypothetical protein